ncbi:hypothetical protein [Acetivibrio mesophilus]|uniref:Uncharacterized protein n=1 Tax=Acetivibrio mesophilus TaxID=2487273 RepID=A0A4Q0I8A1_9FIRM|nr:hypothetical protein [Acetivibrio mesophilus]ODM26261.1 hypothetical protein A7W90_08500 [Clostridium sp. Bc-iso-3]RXE60684.1 hypothetical protein EFD62_01840 [Acetivibrio mesophilus]HHV28097.1 hypothetical protein [Clostridium sp.]
MYPKSLRSVSIASVEVVANIIPLSTYGGKCDVAEIAATIRLCEPMCEDVCIIFPYIDSIYNPEVFTHSSKQILKSFKSEDSEEKQLLELIDASFERLKVETDEEKINMLIELLYSYKELRKCEYVLNIPEGQQFLKISFKKEIPKIDNGINKFDMGDFLSYFSLKGDSSNLGNITVLMPSKKLDMLIATCKPPNGLECAIDKYIIAERVVLSQFWSCGPSIEVSYRYHEENQNDYINSSTGL